MSFTIIDAPQRSAEWFAARVGRMTGSCAADMLATIAKGEAAKRKQLRARLLCERLTGQPQDEGFTNAAMQRGIDCEPLARSAYEVQTGLVVQTTGFLAHDTLAAGCSLDGHVGNFKGIIELKCPTQGTHLDYLNAEPGKVPAEHVAQITHNLWMTDAEWCDFASWDDRFPEPLHLVIARVRRDQVDLKAYESVLTAFLGEIDAQYVALRKRLLVAA